MKDKPIRRTLSIPYQLHNRLRSKCEELGLKLQWATERAVSLYLERLVKEEER